MSGQTTFPDLEPTFKDGLIPTVMLNLLDRGFIEKPENAPAMPQYTVETWKLCNWTSSGRATFPRAGNFPPIYLAGELIATMVPIFGRGQVINFISKFI